MTTLRGIHLSKEMKKSQKDSAPPASVGTPHLRTNILDFRGFDSSMISILRGGIPRTMGDFPESLSQAILVRIMLVGRLGVLADREDMGDSIEVSPVVARKAGFDSLNMIYIYIYIYIYNPLLG